MEQLTACLADMGNMSHSVFLYWCGLLHEYCFARLRRHFDVCLAAWGSDNSGDEDAPTLACGEMGAFFV